MSTAAPAKGSSDFLGTGRRKTSVARVRLRPGSGQIKINGRELNAYFLIERDQKDAIAALTESGHTADLDVIVKVHGGGIASQAGAVRLGVARALKLMDPSLDTMLRHSGLMTRDSRMKERKKYGLRGARRGTQFSKR